MPTAPWSALPFPSLLLGKHLLGCLDPLSLESLPDVGLSCFVPHHDGWIVNATADGFAGWPGNVCGVPTFPVAAVALLVPEDIIN